uniref:Uncharacterized protein n=1 Tax=Rhizophora mucronata TaxID=61149 RepID=A0A2P2P2C6_RHIMU
MFSLSTRNYDFQYLAKQCNS